MAIITGMKVSPRVSFFSSFDLLPVARFVGDDISAHQVQDRYSRVHNRKEWSNEEDERLRIAADAYKYSWPDVAATMTGRTGVQCRARWESFKESKKMAEPKIPDWMPEEPLPEGRRKWTPEEDERLMAAFAEFGNNWVEVSKRLKIGRDPKMVNLHCIPDTN
jgi:hypothetical protein